MVLGLVGAAPNCRAARLVALATGLHHGHSRHPELVLMLLIFYGGTHRAEQHLLEWLGSEATVDINPFTAGVLTIGFIYGAYMTETFRGAMLAIPKGQMEAGTGLWHGPRMHTFVRITRPRWCAMPCLGLPTTGWC
jgi:arginine/ornithine transport system permease protein